MAHSGDTAPVLTLEEIASKSSGTQDDDALPLRTDSELLYPFEPDCLLFKLDYRVRSIIWSYLDFESLRCMTETCSHFEEEILQYVSPVERGEESPSVTLSELLLIYSVPIRNYLDMQTKLAMRLVCRTFKFVVDKWILGPEREWDDDAFDEYAAICRKPRWCECTLCVSGSGGGFKTTIFDLHVHTLRRILQYLPERDLDRVKQVCTSFTRLVKEFREYPFQEFIPSSGEICLMDLPAEIHEKILNFTHSTDRPHLRLVSKLMQIQVDNLVGSTVFLNDLKYGYWKKKTTGMVPPASTLIVANVHTPQSVKYIASNYTCNLLTHIILDGPFPATALVVIMNKCKRLKSIAFSYALEMASIEEELRNRSHSFTVLPFEMNSMKSLNLNIRDKDLSRSNCLRVPGWTWRNAFEMMKTSIVVMPNISSFSICEEGIFSHNLMYEVAEKVLRFIAEHRYTLRSLEVILMGRCLPNCICPPYRPEASENLLRSLRLKKYSVDCDWKISRPFLQILREQKELKNLHCHKLSDWEFYAEVLENNRMSLTSVTIEKSMLSVIDLDIFSGCENLEKLSISHIPLSTDSTEYRLRNLDSLPESIKALHILDSTLNWDEVRKIPKRLKHLKTLDLRFLGDCTEKCRGACQRKCEHVKGALLEIFQMRKLDCLFLEEITKSEEILYSFEMDSEMDSAISSINLLPTRTRVHTSACRCSSTGTLIAEKMPNSHFMHEWIDRVECYIVEGDWSNFRAEAEGYCLHRYAQVSRRNRDRLFLISDEEEEADSYDE